VLDENKWIKNLVEDTRVSLGLGIVLGTQIGRIEANYSWILKSHDHDNIKRAQIGLGMTFT
jgi:outer membrane protein assembly factor BamA